MRFPFPENFLFGAAGSAVQHESACYEDGKGENIHDRCYKQVPEEYFGDMNEAADFYHRYPEDIQMMKELGLRAFRFSISWARIFPNGPEQVNQAGLDYYKDMVDHLMDAGIAPFFDLWHCDLPQWVAERGGLLHPDFSDWFTGYAKMVFEVLGDKVAMWSTVNEPHANVMGVYMDGNYPPFSKGRENSYQASHNMILASLPDGSAVQADGFHRSDRRCGTCASLLYCRTGYTGGSSCYGTLSGTVFRLVAGSYAEGPLSAKPTGICLYPRGNA